MKQAGGKGKPRPAPPRRRRLPRRVRHAALWLLLVVGVVGCYGAIVATRTPVGQAALAEGVDRIVGATAAFGLVVSNIEVEGRETTDVATVMAALSAVRGTPILSVSPHRAKQQLEALPWVRSATIERRLPGTLFVRLVERRPLAVWQHGGIQQLIDQEGAVIPVDDLSRFARLPIVVGAAPYFRRSPRRTVNDAAQRHETRAAASRLHCKISFAALRFICDSQGQRAGLDLGWHGRE